MKLKNQLYILETSEIETGMLTLEVHLSDHKLVLHLALEKIGLINIASNTQPGIAKAA